MNEIVFSKRFARQIRNYRDNKKELNLIYQTITELQNIEFQDNGSLPKCHKLKGKRNELWDRHLKADLVILFAFDSEQKRVKLFSIGNHNNILD